MDYETDCKIKLKRFVTTFNRPDGIYEGPVVSAVSLCEAEGIAARLNGVKIIGVLDG